MINRAKLRKWVVGALSNVPLYWVIPVRGPRDLWTILYLIQNASASEACDFIDRADLLPTGSMQTLILAGRAAFRAGRDDLLEKILAIAGSRYPEQAGLIVLRSDLEAFRGNYAAALQHVEHARLIAPKSVEAAARSVRLHYLATDPDSANRNALDTLKHFSLSAPVLWAVSKHCTTGAQFDKLHTIWRAGLRTPRDLTRTILQLGNAALRVERFAEAAGLYAEAALVELSGNGLNSAIKEKRLEGKGGLSVIGDVREVLEKANIPFFLAAGTALGIVRDGRPLDHDNDIDVGIFEQDWDHERLKAAFQQHPNFDFDNPHSKSHKIGLVHRGGAAIDLFCFYKKNDHFFHDAVFVRWKNAPFTLQEKQLPSGPVMLPSPEDVYLTENYGDWRTPDPGFDAFVQGPNVEVTWPDYFAVHRVRQAYKRICAKDLQGAKRELDAAGPILGESEPGRKLADKLGLRTMSDKQTTAAKPFKEKPETNVTEETLTVYIPASPEVALELARSARAERAYERAKAILDRAIRQGGWTHSSLWWELVSLMTLAADYRPIRQLWHDSPTPCRHNLSLMRAVARAACIAGEHEEARVLLRSAILMVAGRTQRARTLLGWGRRFTRRLLAVNKGQPLPRPLAPFDVRAAEALRDLGRATAELGIRPFLISGTLLGYVRDGAIIGWDKDIDVGVFSDECPEDIEAFFNAQDNFNVRRVDLSVDRLRINHKNGVWIDLFPHYLEGGLLWHDGTATRWWNKPFGLKTVEFLGCEQLVPDDPERYLEENYGRWQDPEPNFDARIDAPNVEVTDQAHFNSLLYFSLLAAITKGKSRMRERYIELLRARGEGEWLDRL